jgi:hypothetical protein
MYTSASIDDTHSINREKDLVDVFIVNSESAKECNAISKQSSACASNVARSESYDVQVKKILSVINLITKVQLKRHMTAYYCIAELI